MIRGWFSRFEANRKKALIDAVKAAELLDTDTDDKDRKQADRLNKAYYAARYTDTYALHVVLEYLRALSHSRRHGQRRGNAAANRSVDMPPLSAEKMLTLIIRPKDREAILGDLEETYVTMRREYGDRHARRWYWVQVMRSAWPLLSSRFVRWSGVLLAGQIWAWLRNHIG